MGRVVGDWALHYGGVRCWDHGIFTAVAFMGHVAIVQHSFDPCARAV